MTPPVTHPAATEAATLSPTSAIILPGGHVALVFAASPTPLPADGTLDGIGPWACLSWTTPRGHAGLALLGAMPPHGAMLRLAQGRASLRLSAPGDLDVTATPLLKLVREGGDAGAILAFLRQHAPTSSGDLAADFRTRSAERAGFVEVAARTECGGLFLQGWAHAFDAEVTEIAGLPGHDARAIAVARFEREDILPPASGFCLYIKQVDPEVPLPEALFFERGGRLGRLDVVPTMAPAFRGPTATAHVRGMLDRLQAPKAVLGAFRRICRPRYEGHDTLSSHDGPVAAALDRVLKAADGGLLVSGWLLDPLSQVERVILKGSGNLYAPLHETWSMLPRPDLNAGFALDPRFAGLLDDRDVMHGFVCHVPAQPGRDGGDLYLELVFENGSCLFRPVDVMLAQGDGVLPAVLSGLSPHEPELPVIVERHLAPFLAGLGRRTEPLRRIGAAMPLGPGPAGRDVSAVMPVAGLAELQPILATLAGTSDAEGMDLTLVVSRSVAAEIRRPLDDAFHFYGLTGSLIVVPDHATMAARLDAGTAAGNAERLLVWQSAALPRGPGWLARLRVEAERVGAGLVSPVLFYEDGSIYFGGERPRPGARGPDCLRAGLGAHAIGSDTTRAVAAGAAEIALVDRSLLARSGGFSGHLFGDTYTHLDLARRLRLAGGETWCASAVAFWMVEDPRPEELTPFAQMTRAVDTALIARRTEKGARP
ncbi:hypothetical protein LX81_01761 [Palleronia aestuarii]|uniref:Uncharacterized protein n=1 Tax=Palleronia aestuarii TaxID=568105 RepID=A0A2W7Q5X2_9RHOB|nr:hypothetical protein [Palleronia aestuarii]PZX17129.1 hypothetical protein LX81_01761 [Palleronia aestuarii]